MVDFDALEAAGIANARERAGLIEYLDGLGFTAEEMVEAERRGRLFGLAGDVLQRSGRPTYSLRTAAEALGVAARRRRTRVGVLGLTVADPDQIALSQADVDGLATWVSLKALVGDERALSLLRVIGATMARLAEARSSVVRAGTPDIQIDPHQRRTHHRNGLWRHRGIRPPHGSIARRCTAPSPDLGPNTFEGVMRDTSESVDLRCRIRGSVRLHRADAAAHPVGVVELLHEFSATVSDVVHADGGRMVKFIGDEVMWVSSTPELLAKVAVDLVEHPRAREAGLQVRAGLGYGRVLAIGGDYFGNAVNLAARLVGAAAPGQILAASEVRDELPDWSAIPQDPLILKGFDSPVTAYDLHLSR